MAGLFELELENATANDDVIITVPSPAITILESSQGSAMLPGVDLLLGLDFLRDHRAVVDLRLDQVRLLINGGGDSSGSRATKECTVSLVRRRRGTGFEDDNFDDNDILEAPTTDYEWEETNPLATTSYYDSTQQHQQQQSLFYDQVRYVPQEEEEFSDEEEGFPDMSGV